MLENTENRIYIFAEYIIENGATVRETGKFFGYGKSTVHSDVTEKLLKLDPALAERVREVLDENFAEKHLRGGEMTKSRYTKQKKLPH